MLIDEVPQGVTLTAFAESGLGDVAMNLARLNGPFGIILPLREKRPDIWIRCVVCSHCPAAVDLVRCCPYFSEIISVPWTEDHARMRREQAPEDRWLDRLHWDENDRKRLPFFLTDWEEEWCRAISAEPFVMFHPFASNAERNWFGRIGQAGADRVVEVVLACGFRVIVIGRSYVKGGREQRDEGYEYHPHIPHPGVTHISGVRSAARLTETAAAVVGSLSAWVSLAGELNRPTWMKIGRTFHHEFLRPGDVFERYYRQKSVVRWWPDDPDDDDLTSLSGFLKSLS